MAVTPVRTSPPRMMVVCPTSTAATSVIAPSGPVGRIPTFNPKSEARGRALAVSATATAVTSTATRIFFVMLAATASTVYAMLRLQHLHQVILIAGLVNCDG
jgi:hypothetical protein